MINYLLGDGVTIVWQTWHWTIHYYRYNVKIDNDFDLLAARSGKVQVWTLHQVE